MIRFIRNWYVTIIPLVVVTALSVFMVWMILRSG
jgi:hypothetical protein